MGSHAISTFNTQNSAKWGNVHVAKFTAKACLDNGHPRDLSIFITASTKHILNISRCSWSSCPAYWMVGDQ
jgi:hypothetical protein